MRASRASELKKNAYLHTKSAISSNILSVQMSFVGTNDILSVQMICLSVQMICLSANIIPTNFQMYRQNSEKALLGGGGAAQITRNKKS